MINSVRRSNVKSKQTVTEMRLMRVTARYAEEFEADQWRNLLIPRQAALPTSTRQPTGSMFGSTFYILLWWQWFMVITSFYLWGASNCFSMKPVPIFSCVYLVTSRGEIQHLIFVRAAIVISRKKTKYMIINTIRKTDKIFARIEFSLELYWEFVSILDVLTIQRLSWITPILWTTKFTKELQINIDYNKVHI